jgi:hypothetical protein
MDHFLRSISSIARLVSGNTRQVLDIASILIEVLAALRALHIIPREPTPLPLEERPEEELTPEELLQVIRILKVDCATQRHYEKALKQPGTRRHGSQDQEGGNLQARPIQHRRSRG